MLPAPPIMLITDRTQAFLPLEEVVESALKGGCRWVLLRDITANDNDFLKQAEVYKKLCAAYQAKLFISRNIQIAQAVSADGLHLSAQQNIAEARALCKNISIGQSCHHEEEIIRAEKNGADYITLSPIFRTKSKPDYDVALGIQKLITAAQTTSLPIIALGGITPSNAKECLAAEVKGIAVMGNIMRSPEPEAEMAQFCSVFLPTD